MDIDSCYVCNLIDEDGSVKKGNPIQLKMDISAEMSFDPNFPMNDGSGSITDDLTFTRAVEMNIDTVLVARLELVDGRIHRLYFAV